jgi:hypothetical protein
MSTGSRIEEPETSTVVKGQYETRENMNLQSVRSRNIPLWLLAAWLLFAGAGQALAELGRDVTTVAADQQQMQGAKRTVRMAENYSAHEYETQSGTAVREYVSPGGKVFGVSWQGQRIPDLRQLLGAYYDQYERAAAAARIARHRGPLVIQEPGLVVQSGGHMRAYSGWAYAPDLLPAGVRAEEIR